MPMRLGVPKESAEGERRVAVTPESVRRLVEAGFAITVEAGAGEGSGVADAAYAQAGATVGSADEAWAADVVAKVRPPSESEARRLREGAALVSLLQPDRNPAIVPILVEKRVSAVALERIPRITRAQKMDVLSSMANLAGYRAVVEAATLYQGFFGPQVTAAGTTPPARVLVIGAGVAGLAAVAAAKALGAEVRAFDTRAAAREQVESLGARFLQVELHEIGEGEGGYARVMSKEFYEAEMALFRQQAAEVDIIVTTALVPGRKAPILLPRSVVEKLKPGSIVVDLAAEQGGNCELTVPGRVVDENGVRYVGYTDLASRMASSASRFFASNVAHLLVEMGGGRGWKVDLESDVVRPALVTHAGAELPAPPPKPPTIAPELPPKPVAKPPPPEARPQQESIISMTRRAWGTTIGSLALIVALFLVGRFAPGDFLQHFTVFILACFVGWQVIWSVTPALHTPLMSVTNAISGIIIIGGMLQIGSALDRGGVAGTGPFGIDLASLLGAAAVLVAAINVAGGFLVTQRMLRMFHREPSPSRASGASSTGHGGAR